MDYSDAHAEYYGADVLFDLDHDGTTLPSMADSEDPQPDEAPMEGVTFASSLKKSLEISSLRVLHHVQNSFLGFTISGRLCNNTECVALSLATSSKRHVARIFSMYFVVYRDFKLSCIPGEGPAEKPG